MKVDIHTEYRFECPCGAPARYQNKLIEGKYLQCHQCFRRYYQGKDGGWKELEESKDERALRKRMAGF